MTNITAIVNQKGGVGKTTTTANLGVALAQKGDRVLLVDLDPQSNLTSLFGYDPDSLELTVGDCMQAAMDGKVYIPFEAAVLHHADGVDILPSNIVLAGYETSMINAIGRESILKNTLEYIEGSYDRILIDCAPTLGQLSINALCAANKLIVPVQSQILALRGLEQLLGTVSRVRRGLNPTLEVEGILLTMTTHTSLSHLVEDSLRNAYGEGLKIFNTAIPTSVRAAELASVGHSIFAHDRRGKVSEAYAALAVEIKNAERRRQVKKEGHER